jgi:hypothetical protein
LESLDLLDLYRSIMAIRGRTERSEREPIGIQRPRVGRRRQILLLKSGLHPLNSYFTRVFERKAGGQRATLPAAMQRHVAPAAVAVYNGTFQTSHVFHYRDKNG